MEAIAFTNCQYDPPGGAVGRSLVDLLSEEVTLLGRGRVKSECLIVFLIVLLQHNEMVRKGADIRRLLKRCMTAWREEKFEELLQEAVTHVHCSLMKKWSKVGITEADEKHTIEVFTSLMLRGQVRSAV